MTTQVTNSPVDNLVAGSFPQLVTRVTLLAGAKHYKGEVLELNGSSKAILVATAANAKYVLAEDIDATDADVEALVYITGQFHLDECNINSLDATAITEALHLRSIFLK